MDKNLKIAVILSAYDKMSTVVNSAVDKAQRKLKGMEKFQKGLNSFGNAGLLGGGLATAYFATTVKGAEENKIAVDRLNQVYKSMGQNVAEASKQSQDYASKLEFQIGVEDEEILAVQAKLATFSKVSDATARMSGLMDRATAAAYDLAATGFGEASQNAVILGKALQDPARGAMALARAGALNKADLPLIKQIQATKGLKAVQEFVLKAVEKQVKGVAAATALASKKTAVAWSEVTEQIGKNLLPVVERFANYLVNVIIPNVQAFIDKHGTLVKWVAAGSVAFLGLGAAAKVVAFGMGGLSPVITAAGSAIKFFGSAVGWALRLIMANPIILVIAAIAAGAYLIYKNWDKIKAWFSKLWDNVKAIFSKTWQWIKNMFLNYTPYGLVIKHWAKISGFFAGLWNNVKGIFSSVWQGIKSIVWSYLPPVLIYKYWDEIVTYFTNIWEKVKNVFKNAWKNIKNGIKSFFGAGNNDADTVAAAYEKSLNAVNEKTAKAIAFSATSYVKTGGAAGPSTGITGSLRPVPVSNNSTINYSPNVVLNGAATPADAANFIAMTKVDAVKIMQQADARKQRVGF